MTAILLDRRRMRADRLAGRRELLEHARGLLGADGRVALGGVPGAGRSAVLAELCGAGAVLVRMAPDGAGFGYGGVAEVLGALPDGCLDTLPGAQRAAAEAVLRRNATTATDV